MDQLTARQKAILEFIAATRDDRGYPPSVREIGDAVGLASPSSVHAQLATLAAKGFLTKDPTKPRAISVHLDRPATKTSRAGIVDVPVVGRIAAGSPIL